MKQSKKEWINDLSRESFVFFTFSKLINGKKQSVSYFTMHAEPEFRNDKDLNILNFNQTGNYAEIPEGMLDFDFVKKAFNLHEKKNIINLPYEWKNNQEEKDFLLHILEVLGNKSKDLRSNEIMWVFEPGFWSDLEYTKKVCKFDYDYLSYATIKDLSKVKNKEHTDFMFNLININPYYLKYLSTKHKNMLPEKTILNYAKNYGLKSLTKEQKDNFNVIKEAFHFKHTSYNKLDDKWKNEIDLIILLNDKEIWSSWVTGSQHIHVSEINPKLFESREIIKSILSNGYNLLELKKAGYQDIFEDIEFKKIALKTFTNYEIIEDLLDNKDMVLYYLKELYNSKINIINLHEQTKRINPELFKDKEIMLSYLKIRSLDEKNGIIKPAKDAFEDYNIDDCLDFIKVNKESYKVMPPEKQNNIELAALFYEVNKWVTSEMSQELQNKITKLGRNFEDVLPALKSYALEENLQRKLNENNIKQHKKIKV